MIHAHENKGMRSHALALCFVGRICSLRTTYFPPLLAHLHNTSSPPKHLLRSPRVTFTKVAPTSFGGAHFAVRCTVFVCVAVLCRKHLRSFSPTKASTCGSAITVATSTRATTRATIRVGRSNGCVRWKMPQYINLTVFELKIVWAQGVHAVIRLLPRIAQGIVYWVAYVQT